MYTAVLAVKIPRLARANIIIKLKRLVLCKDTNGINTRIYTVRKRKINDTVFSAIGNGRLSNFTRKNAKSASLSACKQHRNAFLFFHKNISRFIFTEILQLLKYYSTKIIILLFSFLRHLKICYRHRRNINRNRILIPMH